MPADLKVELITEEKDLLPMEGIWNPLLSRSGTRNVYLTFEWISTWWRHFGHLHRLCVVVARRGNDVVGLFPLMVTSREGFRQLGVISGKFTAYKDFVIDAGEDREAVIHAMLQTLLDAGGWDVLFLKGFPESSLNFSAFVAATGKFPQNRVVWREGEISLHLPLEGTFDEYMKRLSKNLRKKISNLRNRIDGDLGSFSFSDVKEEELEAMMDKMYELKSIRWRKVKGEESLFDDPRQREFQKDIARRLMSGRNVLFSVFYINKEVASLNICFRHEDKLFGILNAYEEKYSRYSPGLLQEVQMIKQMFDGGFSDLDFLTGTEPYKYSLGPVETRLHSISLFNGGVKSRLAYGWFFGIRPYLERAEKTPLKKLYWWYRKKLENRG